MTSLITIRQIDNDVDPQPSIDVRKLRKWGDPVMVDLMGADTELINSTNFQVVQTATIGDDGKPFFNCINRFQKNLDYDYLESLQYPSDGYTVQQKMNWLVNYKTHGVSAYWMKDSPILYFGPLVFGGQFVQLGETITVNGKYPNRDDYEDIEFRRLIGLRRSDFGKYTYQTHPHLIQRATAAYRMNKYTEYPRGEIFHPVWSDLDYPANYGDGKLWVASALLDTEVVA
ncbi:MAG TPA: hypothetical protein VJ987_14330 [Anaerolineales bacterium]|nr:hypothetical protein [Anaerolineales bacterium]